MNTTSSAIRSRTVLTSPALVADIHVAITSRIARSSPVIVRSAQLPIATAVSAMRLEKPHSLSYQATTRTKVPSITLVWSTAKVAECGSWLRSEETSGSFVQVTMPAEAVGLRRVMIALLTSSTVVGALRRRT